MSTKITQSKNEVINSLNEGDREWLLSRGSLEDAPVKRMFVRPGETPSHVYFVEGGLVSMVVRMSDDQTVEVGTIGTEGLVGIQIYLGGDLNNVEIFQQVEGEVYAVSVEDFRDLLDRSNELESAMSAFTLSLLRQMTMAIACNRLHPVEQRLARWLLMVRDRVQSDQFELTQLFLAEMLGVRRPGVSIAAGMLQRAGLIKYTRGKIQIKDGERLEAAACECYGALRRGRKQ
jgi:CRP-like cAMP-binding protein